MTKDPNEYEHILRPPKLLRSKEVAFSYRGTKKSSIAYDVITVGENHTFMYVIECKSYDEILFLLKAKFFITRELFTTNSPRALIKGITQQLKSYLQEITHLVCACYNNIERTLTYHSIGEVKTLIVDTEQKTLKKYSLPPKESLSSTINDEHRIQLNTNSIFYFTTCDLPNLHSLSKDNEFLQELMSSQDGALRGEIIESQEREVLVKEMGFTNESSVVIQSLSYYEDIEGILSPILKQMDRHKFNDHTIRIMKLVMTEMIANGITHGNRDDHSKKVIVGSEVLSDKILFSVMDEGSGFDPHIIPDPTSQENILKNSGRGIFIMYQYADEIYYNDKCNRTLIVKHRE